MRKNFSFSPLPFTGEGLCPIGLPVAVRRTLLGIGFLIVLAVSAIALNSCNVTRTITNQSEYYQRGDTSIIIQTKTIETYDASKKMIY